MFAVCSVDGFLSLVQSSSDGGNYILKMLIHRVTPGGSPRLDLIGLGASAVTDGDLRSWIPQGGREHRLPVKIRELL